MIKGEAMVAVVIEGETMVVMVVMQTQRDIHPHPTPGGCG